MRQFMVMSTTCWSGTLPSQPWRGSSDPGCHEMADSRMGPSSTAPREGANVPGWTVRHQNVCFGLSSWCWVASKISRREPYWLLCLVNISTASVFHFISGVIWSLRCSCLMPMSKYIDQLNIRTRDCKDSSRSRLKGTLSMEKELCCQE